MFSTTTNMIAFVLFVISIIFLCIKFLNRKEILTQFPEPPSNFFLGHVAEIGSTTEIIATVSRYIKAYGKTVRLRVGPKIAPLLIGIQTTDYKFIEFLLSSNKILTKSMNYKFLKPWLGSGLLISDGEHWKKHRKFLTPAFHFEILKQFVSVFESVGTVLVDKFNKYENSQSIDLHPFVILYTLDVISESAMGTKINAQKGENSSYVKSVKEMCRIIIDRCLSPFKIYDWTFVMTRDFYVQKKCLNILHTFTSAVIGKRKEIFENGIENEKKKAFLDLLLKYSENGTLMSYEEIREEVDTFMFAGHDTTAAAICFTLFCLAENQQIQAKVLEEQKELFGDEKNPEISYQELQNMKYLELVIKETLRLYPVVPVIGRSTTEDVEFDGGIIPKNTNIAIFIYGLHRNPDVFPDPEKFDPDRFRNFDTSLPYSYIPFSAGPRNCIGQKFALLEMKSVISKIIRHFEVIPATPRHNMILAAETVLKSTNGIKIGLRKRF